jgi:hypothetical protein
VRKTPASHFAFEGLWHIFFSFCQHQLLGGRRSIWNLKYNYMYTQETIGEIFKVVNIFITALLFTLSSNILNCYQRQRMVYRLHVHPYPQNEGSISLEILISTCSVSGSRWPRALRHRHSAARLLKLWVESHRLHGCLSVVRVVYCQVEVCATSWALVHRSPTYCSASLFVI